MNTSELHAVLGAVLVALLILSFLLHSLLDHRSRQKDRESQDTCKDLERQFIRSMANLGYEQVQVMDYEVIEEAQGHQGMSGNCYQDPIEPEAPSKMTQRHWKLAWKTTAEKDPSD